jgi:hypothetical protein
MIRCRSSNCGSLCRHGGCRKMGVWGVGC